ncbi:hypothetical protein GL325_14730 [Aeromicrobium sp. 636]|uniref:Uncharacterized protein n=1 Tax=Aeromicrobium senzhongii TaxID=2663859 RepID=A0A8I0EWA6_9ACTN|nr:MULTISPECIES: hypothetical protein [Aeromicrobium]MBC9227581.1 hypothetical protein [Aeromicrobium senzhongii]MCQ3999678.1 hypothetical protein [Aeromicrobium sp. 636]
MRVRPAVPVRAVVRLARRGLARWQRPAAARERGPATAATWPPEVIGRLEAHVSQLSVAERRALDPTTHPRDFRQPDQLSCGAAALVVSRLVHDRPYALWMATGHDPHSDRTDSSTAADRWRSEVLAMHRRVTGLRDHDGDLQWPWLRMVGTSPWGAARQMTGDGGSGVPGARYTARTLDPEDLGTEFDRLMAAVEAGHTAPLYVGNDLRPAHVVLAVRAAGHDLEVYEPSAGQMVRVARDEFAAGRFSLGGWPVPWFAVLPR